METNELSVNANGGTELMLRGLEGRVDADLLSNFQIIPSRVRELREDKVRILWCHDLPEDPEADRALRDGGWRKFHKLVFVSNWQMQRFAERFGIDWGRCVVMQNAIVPLPAHEKPKDKVRLIYTSTPQRGLDVLAAVFAQIPGDDLELEIFSSFDLYGWPEADKAFVPLFDKLRADPRVVYHGARPNDEVRKALQRSHVFAYPSTWTETSCLCLIEAMSAGLICVHPNLGALFETAGNMTLMYQWDGDKNKHAGVFRGALEAAIDAARNGYGADATASQKSYADLHYNWKGRAAQWTMLLSELVDKPRAFEVDVPMWEYRA